MVFNGQNLQSLIDDVTNLFRKKTQFVQHQPQPQPLLNNSFQPPIRGSYQCSGVFSPNAPTDYRHSKHDGVDLRAPGGTAVYPITDGIIINVGSGGKGGNTVTIDHYGKIKTYYAHLGTVSVHKGDKVNINSVIGTVGDSGNAKGTSPHIHFQVWYEGQLTNPSKFFAVPKYTNLQPGEKSWLSEEAKEEASAFNMNQHLQQRQQAFAQAVAQLEKIAEIYYQLTKKL
jgi:murein DD-endopeptidase MepM/ murein hydrolase activator NlpD